MGNSHRKVWSIEYITDLLLAYHERTSGWPHAHSGVILGDGRTWAAVDAYLNGHGSSISQMCSNLGREGGKYLPEGTRVVFPKLTLKPGQPGYDRELIRKTLHLPMGLVLEFARKNGRLNTKSLLSQRCLLKKVTKGYDSLTPQREYYSKKKSQINKTRRTRHSKDIIERPDRVAKKRAASIKYYETHLDEMVAYRRSRYSELAGEISANGLVFRATQRERYLWDGAKERARVKGLDFDIEPSDIEIPEFCPLLGIKLLIPSPTEGHKKVQPNSATLDQITPGKGYVKGNVWVVSFKANTIKSDATPEELNIIAENLESRLASSDLNLVKSKITSKSKKLRTAAMCRAAKRRAKEKGFDFNLEVSDIEIPEFCPLLGVQLYVSKHTGGRKNTRPNSATLDRIDSTKGYVKGNVWVISHRANTIKNIATSEELRVIASVVENKLNSSTKKAA